MHLVDTQLSKNLRGKMIDVGSSAQGIINPFHIITTLEADEGGSDDSYSIHLQFLEQFFRVIMEGMSSDAFEVLNSAVVEVYKEKGSLLSDGEGTRPGGLQDGRGVIIQRS